MIKIKKLQEIICRKDFLNFLDNMVDYEECLHLSFQKPIANNIKEYKNKLAVISWQEHENNLYKAIIKSLQNFIPVTVSDIMPKSGLKGVYFCLGDSGGILQIAGSIYYNEKDWTANADFYAECDGAYSILKKISDLLRSKNLDREYIETIEYFFMTFVIYRLMYTLDVPDVLANAGIALGYSDGDELILGHFQNCNFVGELRITKEYDKQFSAPIVRSFAERGALWNYLQHNYYRYLKAEGLEDRFIMLGEAEAERICALYKNIIFVNKCNKCNFIKMTPKARLCQNCGDFTPPDIKM